MAVGIHHRSDVRRVLQQLEAKGVVRRTARQYVGRYAPVVLLESGDEGLPGDHGTREKVYVDRVGLLRWRLAARGMRLKARTIAPYEQAMEAEIARIAKLEPTPRMIASTELWLRWRDARKVANAVVTGPPETPEELTFSNAYAYSPDTHAPTLSWILERRLFRKCRVLHEVMQAELENSAFGSNPSDLPGLTELSLPGVAQAQQVDTGVTLHLADGKTPPSPSSPRSSRPFILGPTAPACAPLWRPSLPSASLSWRILPPFAPIWESIR